MFLAVLGVTLYFCSQELINFNNDNASRILIDDISWRLHDRYYMAGALLFVIAIFSFIASFYEVTILFQISNAASGIAIFGMLMFVVSNQLTASMISEQLDSKCNLVMPQFSNDMLMRYGCPTKYLS